MKLELFKISDLKLDPENARKHNAKNLAAISKSFDEFDQLKNIVVDKNNVVIAGNGTVQTFIEKGKTEIWGVRSHLSEEKNRAFALADNRTAELAEWDTGNLEKIFEKLRASDIKLDDVGFEPADLDDLGLAPKNVGLTDDDAIPEVAQNIHGVKRGDIWQLGEHRLMCGDSTKKEDVERLMAGEKADMVFTSPPYNQNLDSFKPSGMQKESPNFVNKMASAYFDSMPETDYQSNQLVLLEQIHSITKDNASVFYNHKHRYREKEVLSPLSWLWKSSWKLRQEIIWDRAGSITLNARMFMPVDERIYWLTKGDFYFDDSTEVKSWGSIWHIAPKNEIKGVSAPFPNELPERGIRACSKPNGLVFEPYCGSGTTLIACEKTNRKCYGMEIDEHYCSVIIERWQQFTGKKAVKLDLTNS